LKLIPRVVEGPWIVKKLVGTNPIMIGQKVPVSYYGSINDNYLEICINVASGGQVENKIATTCATKADSITIDLGFVVEATGPESRSGSRANKVSDDTFKDSELPETMLGAVRVHHLNMKNKGAYTEKDWAKELLNRNASIGKK